jgi:hypothetical protein
MNEATRVSNIDECDPFEPDESSVRTEGADPNWFDEAGTLAEKHQTENIQFEIGDWINEGKALAEKHQTTSLQWDVGDWFNRCPLPDDVDGSPKPYDLAESMLGIQRSTLYDWASTAKRIPASVRTENVPFTHHRIVANELPNADDATKKRWLELAAAENLSVREFQDRLRESRGAANPDLNPTKSFIVKVPERVYLTLRNIARGRESTVRVVAAEFLTTYLASDEVTKLADVELAQAEERTYQKRRRAGIRTARAYNPLGLDC